MKGMKGLKNVFSANFELAKEAEVWKFWKKKKNIP